MKSSNTPRLDPLPSSDEGRGNAIGSVRRSSACGTERGRIFPHPFRRGEDQGENSPIQIAQSAPEPERGIHAASTSLGRRPVDRNFQISLVTLFGILFGAIGSGAPPSAAQPSLAGDDLFKEGHIPQIRLELSRGAMDQLRQHPRTYVSGTIREGN